MITRSQEPGEAYDRLMQDRRRLAITHFLLGLVASFVYYTRPTSLHLMPIFVRSYGLAVMVTTVLAWAPYLLSWRVSRSILAGSRRGVMAFIPIAVAITIGAAAFYLSLFETQLPMIILSACVALLLVGAAGLCVVIGGASADD